MVLGSALAAGVAAFPANATSYTDTAVSASAVTDESLGVSGLGATDGTGTIVLTGTGVSSWSLNSAANGETLSGSTIGCNDDCTNATSATVVADAKDSNGNAEALVISVVIVGDDSIQLSASDSFTTDTVTGLTATNNSDGTITFGATSKDSLSITYGESNLPTGLTSANPLTYSGGTAVPGTYTGVKATATDSDGAVLNGTFTLTVDGNAVTTSTGEYGNYVNKFGNGFDSYRQHDYAGAIIAGWPATQSDPATHFIVNDGTTSGAIQLEYAPNDSDSGLCVSDPAGGWGSDPLRDGLILANCNSGPFQQFIPQSDGTLVNVATGLIVNPDGKGAQLRGESTAASWGGSSYTYTAYSSLP
jgi:hypothetical protein